MATSFEHTPRVDDKLPSLRRVITWQPSLCEESMSVALGSCAPYLILCSVGRRIMRDLKPPFKLKGALSIWNLSLATFSALGASRVSMCAPPTPIYGHGPVSLWLWLFIVSKAPELVDTALIVTQEATYFLHWYHHITVLFYCWNAFGTHCAMSVKAPSSCLVFCSDVNTSIVVVVLLDASFCSGTYFVAMNYSVHAVMYFYYFLMACGYQPRWERFVTMSQLIQMGVRIVVCIFNVY
ncbi:hypothetical protein PsorP6_005703 [Peronosclerospora sorghi]|uniref:Uncharacterized protein n=1 Tax=Peronosclerospora sorghi TaxID=230839 RepID=A0ACC0W722_9STRA|nr:hypothetical protein PsorP6_005703 [Peronosclerospora sorghi]